MHCVCNVMCDLSGSTAFLHIISQMARFSKEVVEKKCVFLFSLQLLSETFLVLIRIKLDIVINLHSYSCKVPTIQVRF